MNVFVLKLRPIAPEQPLESTSRYDSFCERYIDHIHQSVKYQEQLLKLTNLTTLTFYKNDKSLLSHKAKISFSSHNF